MSQENTEKEIIPEEQSREEVEANAGQADDAVAENGQDSKMSRKEAKAMKKEKTEKLEKEIEDLKASLAKEKDDYIRLMAEFDNFRRRTSQEKLELVNVASEDTIKGLLPVIVPAFWLLRVREGDAQFLQRLLLLGA